MSCGAWFDCESRVCNLDGVCVAPSCEDGVQNGDEEGPDCGGSCARSCPAECSGDVAWTAVPEGVTRYLEGEGLGVEIRNEEDASSAFEPPDGCTTKPGGGPEMVVRFEAPHTGTLLLTTDFSVTNADTVLYVFAERCDPDATILGCSDDLPDENLNSALEIDGVVGDVIFVVVDRVPGGELGLLHRRLLTRG